MNKDLDERLLPPGEFRDAVNVSIGTSQSSDVGAVENTKGNDNVSSLGFLTVNARCIGAVTNDEDFKIYWFVRDGDISYIFEYDELNNLTTTVVADDRAVGINMLNFQATPSTTETYLITGVNYHDGYLMWTDNFNPPRYLNVGRAKGNTANYGTNWATRPANLGGPLNGNDIDVIVKPPFFGPYITLQQAQTGGAPSLENNIEERFLEFAYRWKYQDNRYSALSPFSATAFQPGVFNYDYIESINTAMVNEFNQVTIQYDTGNPQVEEIQIVMRDTKVPTVYIVENINKEELGYASNTKQTVEFNNSKIYTALNPTQVTRLFDNVPLKAQAQEIIGTRVIYGNYLEFRDLTWAGNDIDLRYTVDYTSLNINSTLPGVRSFRSDRDYEIGIAYLDEYQRQTTVLTPPTITSGPLQSNSTIYIPPTQSITANDIQLKIFNYAPDWATHYRLYIKQKKDEYYTIYPLLYYAEGAARWFLYSKADRDKFNIGDYLIAKSDAKAPTLSNTQYKVLDIDYKAEDFLGNGEPQGLYFKLGVSNGEFNPNDLFTAGTYAQGMIGRLGDLTTSGFQPMPSFNADEYFAQTNTDTIAHRHHYENVDDPIPYPKNTNNLNLVSIVPPYTGNLNPNTYFNRDRRLYIEIIGNSGAGDTFNVYDIQGTYYNTTPITILPTPMTLPGGVLKCANGDEYQIQFGATTGHTVGDRWAINVRSSRRYDGESVGGGLWGRCADTGVVKTGLIAGPSDEQKEGGFSILLNDTFLTVGPSNDPHNEDATDKAIQPGAQITFDYIEEDQGGSQPTITTPMQTYWSSRRYVNIEEWFYEDGIYNKFVQFDGNGNDQGNANVWFRRGFNWQNRQEKQRDYCSMQCRTVNANSRPPVRMVIKGFGKYLRAMRNVIMTNMQIIQADHSLVFETVPLDDPAEIYHEVYTSDPLPCTTAPTGQNLHGGNLQSQVVGGFAWVSLNNFNATAPGTQPLRNTLYNAYSFGNGVESNRIKDDFNAPTLKYSPRVNTIIEDYKQERKKDSLTYSGVYGYLINGFNEFNLSLGNFKDLDISFGSVQKLFSRDTNLVVFQQDKVSKVLYGKNLLSDAVGGGSVVSTPLVLGNQMSYIGEYGISDNPESFASWGSNLYFTDERRGAVLSINGEGVNEISANGMRDYFKDFFLSNPREVRLGAVDPYTQKYNLAGRDLDIPCVFSVRRKGIENAGLGNLATGDSVYVSSVGGNVCFLIEASGAWSATAVGGSPAWLNSITPVTGSGDGSVCINLAASTVNRSFVLRFAACGTTVDVTIFQRAMADVGVVVPIIEVSPKESTQYAKPSYAYSGNPTGVDIDLDTQIGENDSPIALWGGTQGWPPNDGVPADGSAVRVKAPAELADPNAKGFENGLGNTMAFLITNTAYGPEDLSAIKAAATLLTPIYIPGEERWDDTFWFNNPAGDKYLYLVLDYKDRIAAGSTGNSLGKLGTNYVELELGSDVGKSSVSYDANNTPNRFVVKYNNAIVGDTGYVGLNTLANYNDLIAAGVPDSEINLSFPYNGLVNNGVGTIEFKKYDSAITTGELVVYTKTSPADGWDAGVTAPGLTAFNINPNGQSTESAVCALTAGTTYYHNGTGVSPTIGDVIYSTANGSVFVPANGLYYATGVAGPANTWIVISSRGLVVEVGDCSCSEVAVPVINNTEIAIFEDLSISYQIPATNNPTTWSLTSTCVNYILYGGDDGAVFSGTNCLVPEAKVVTVAPGATVIEPFENLSVSILSGGPSATATAGEPSLETILPKGLSFLNGEISGTPIQTGLYTFNVTATNCFGTSAITTITINVRSQGFNRFLMDGATEFLNAADACSHSGTATYTRYYHDGDGAYPVVNDVVAIYNENLEQPYVPYNGGNRWYIMDNNVAIQIRIDGRVVDAYDCTSGSLKVTEAGPGGFAPNTTKTTEGGSNKTLE